MSEEKDGDESMPEIKDVETEVSENTAVEICENSEAEISENTEVCTEHSETKNEKSEDNQIPEGENEKQDDVVEPPAVQDDDPESRWCDDYQFVDDEKQVIDYEGKEPKKAVLLAAQNNELEILRKLLETDPDLINARDNDLYTPLHRACYSNNVEVIRILLSYEADISARTVDGWEPLHCACKWDSVEAVSLLIQNGADINAQTKGHITPLHLAASNVHGRRTLELLLWHPHVDPNIKNDAGDTAYDIAVRSGTLGALFEILEKSVNVY